MTESTCMHLEILILICPPRDVCLFSHNSSCPWSQAPVSLFLLRQTSDRDQFCLFRNPCSPVSSERPVFIVPPFNPPWPHTAGSLFLLECCYMCLEILVPICLLRALGLFSRNSNYPWPHVPGSLLPLTHIPLVTHPLHTHTSLPTTSTCSCDVSGLSWLPSCQYFWC